MKKLIALALLGACLTVHAQSAPSGLDEEFMRSEKAAAKAMAERNLADFTRLVDDDAVFYHMGQTIKGKAAVVEFVRPMFAGPHAPFSSEVAEANVLPGGLAMTSGPVRAAPDNRIVARYNTVWRRAADGAWKIVFDRSWAAGQ